MTVDVASHETAASDPRLIDFNALFTRQNRERVVYTGSSVGRLLRSVASFLEKNRDARRETICQNADNAADEMYSIEYIHWQVLALLAPYIYGNKRQLKRANLVEALHFFANRSEGAFARENAGWFAQRTLRRRPTDRDAEHTVAYSLYMTLVPLFGADTVEHCNVLIQLNQGHCAKVICAGPLETIERWIAMPAATLPTPKELRNLASDHLSKDILRTVAAGIYEPFATAIGRLSDDERERTAAILRRFIQRFVELAYTPLVGCSKAMDQTLTELLEEINLPLLFLHEKPTNFVPAVLALQILFLAFYNASMMIPPEDRLPSEAEVIATVKFPQLRTLFGTETVPEIVG